MEALLIYPHQLYKNHSGLQKDRKIFLVEEPLFFTEHAVHTQKLMLHRLSMKVYKKKLKEDGYNVTYLAIEDLDASEDVFDILKKEKVNQVYVADVTDQWLEKRIIKGSENTQINITWLPSQLFILEKEEAKGRYISSKKFMKNFYKNLRIDKGILMEDDEPAGGKWSFDEDNRKKLPKGIELPKDIQLLQSDEIAEVREWVKDLEGEIYGDDIFWIPYTHEMAEVYFEKFLKERFKFFGDYEDAMTSDHVRIFHSTLSPMINVGLLDPQVVIDQAIAFAEKNNVPLNCLEGFIRQILGWREFIRASYEVDATKMRTKNFWKHLRSMPEEFWIGTTELDPVDEAINRALRFGYNHHIERLMILGNTMLLSQINPDQVYRWFMAMYVDAYDWVMVPNVYGMSQFADGGIFATKPYIAGANYIKKMSDYKKGPWEETLTGLYWNFIEEHLEFFESNHRLSMMPRLLAKMDEKKKERHKQISREFFKRLW